MLAHCISFGTVRSLVRSRHRGWYARRHRGHSPNMADAAPGYARTFRTSISGYLWLAPIGCHLNVGVIATHTSTCPQPVPSPRIRPSARRLSDSAFPPMPCSPHFPASSASRSSAQAWVSECGGGRGDAVDSRHARAPAYPRRGAEYLSLAQIIYYMET